MPLEATADRADIELFIKAKVVILTAAPSSISDWVGAPWATHCWWAGDSEKDTGRPPPESMQRIVLADFRAVRGRGREVIELIVLPRRRRVRQEPRIKLPFFEGEITTYKTALRLPVLAALADNCKHLSSAEKEWFRAACAAQFTGYRGVGEFLRDYSRQVSAGDNFARFMALLRIIAEHLPGQAAVLFDNYVDNLVSQAKDGRVASKRLQRLKDFSAA
eukprot:g79991.t1